MQQLDSHMGGQTTELVPSRYRLMRKRRELQDTWTLSLSPLDEPLPRGEAGQFNMVYAFGVGEVPISISGDLQPSREGAQQPTIHTIRAVGATSGALCRMRIGETVGIRGPFGTAWPIAQHLGKDLLILAGGIGLAPLRPVIYHVLAQRQAYGKISILYGSRSPDTLLFRRELARWRNRTDMQVEVTVDQADASWPGRVGVVPALIGRVSLSAATTVVYLCGPEIMMRITARSLISRGIAEKNIYLSVERNMKCAIGLCGHCQLGPKFICKDGPIFSYDQARPLLETREL